MKYPALILGIIMFAIFVSDDKTKAWWNKISKRYKPSTCDVTVERVQKKAPSNWKMNCPDPQLLELIVEFKHEAKDFKTLRTAMYRDIVNILTKFGHYSNPETLEHLVVMRLKLQHRDLNILAQTDGLAVVQLLKLKDKKAIAEHLKLTVKVKESTK